MSSHDEHEGPRLSGVLFIGFLTLLLGAVLGTASLISQPVTALQREPDPEKVEPGEVIYVRGDHTGRTAWRGKEQAWKTGQLNRLILTESELNQWSKERLEISQKSDAEESSWKDLFKIVATPVNFHIKGEEIQLATELRIPGLLPNNSFQYIVHGKLEPSDDGMVFIPESGTLGNAPLGSVPVSREWLYGFVKHQFSQIEGVSWLAESFSGIQSVEIIEGRLVLQRKERG